MSVSGLLKKQCSSVGEERGDEYSPRGELSKAPQPKELRNASSAAKHILSWSSFASEDYHASIDKRPIIARSYDVNKKDLSSSRQKA